jgi:long-chain acyl-CoA synthetase
MVRSFSREDLMNTVSLGMMLKEACEKYPRNVSLIYNDRRLTYGDIDRYSNALSNIFKDLNIRKGDKISLMLPNIPEFALAYLAAAKLGAVAVTLNILSTPYELTYLLNNSDSKILVTTSSSAKKFEEIGDQLETCGHLLCIDDPREDGPIRSAMRDGPFECDLADVDKDDPAVMIYTSGLTGDPLGAVLTHGNLSTQWTLLKDICEGTDQDRGLAVIPLFHSFGASANLLSVLHLGASAVLMDQFSIDKIFQTIEQEKVTYIAAVPRLFLGMLMQQGTEKYDLGSLRICITGGSAMPPKFIPAFEQKFNVRLMEGYGLTEASPVCSVSRLHMEQKPGSIGIPIPGAQAKVVDDSGNKLPADTEGELVIKGANVMKGYYKNDEATAEVIHNGWLHTGDLGRIDTDGYIFLTGRKKRMIITSGFNIYPREVERVLDMHPAVAESRVVAKADLMRGEIVKALIVREETIEVDDKEILRHCRKYLSSHKIPREVEFVEGLDDRYRHTFRDGLQAVNR